MTDNTVGQPLISQDALNEIRQDINNTKPELAIRAQTSEQARAELARHVRKNYTTYIKGDQRITEYIVKEIVGIGFLEDILATEGVTDISWNGSFLTVETNQDKVSMTKEDLGGEDVINEAYINRIVNKFLASQDEELNAKNPIIDLLQGNLRLSIIDNSLSPSGTTFSIRVTRPSLALNQSNFMIFAPQFILDFIHTIMLTGAVSTISGITGTGKTELQKLMISFTNPKEKIIMVEDVAETHLKELFPDKDIMSYLTSPEHPISELVRASLRNNPNWVHIAETRGAEAFEMLQGVLTGNFMVTSLHTVDTYAVPKRFSNMITNEYANASEASIIEDVLEYFNFGFHIEKVDITDETTGKSKRIRFLSEIREFKNDENRGTLIFKQEFSNGQFYITTNPISEEYQAQMAKKFLRFEMPKYTRQERTDLLETEEGQMLANIRKTLGEKGRKVHSDVYNGYMSEDDISNRFINGVDQSIRPEYGTKLESDESLYVTPNSREDYSNPHNVKPTPHSLYQSGLGGAVATSGGDTEQLDAPDDGGTPNYRQPKQQNSKPKDRPLDLPKGQAKKKMSFKDRIMK